MWNLRDALEEHGKRLGLAYRVSSAGAWATSHILHGRDTRLEVNELQQRIVLRLGEETLTMTYSLVDDLRAALLLLERHLQTNTQTNTEK